MTDEEFRPIRIVQIPIREVERLEKEMNSLHLSGYTIMDVKQVSIDLEPYYHVFAHFTFEECMDSECPDCCRSEEDDDEGPVGFKSE